MTTKRSGKRIELGRRSFFRSALMTGTVLIAGIQTSGCSDSPSRPTTEPAGPSAGPVGMSVLLAYFSRAGENYYYGGRTQLRVGNTEILAGMISARIKCDVYRIQPADPYPDNYDQTVARNVREQAADARPAIVNPLPSLDHYDAVLLGSPIWNIRAPMIMTTFTEKLDFAGKTVFR